MANYNFVIDSSFQPFSMQEMLIPFTAYKEAFEKDEERYAEIAEKADKFKYLSETLPENSQARQIYEGYANELKKQALDFGQNGLSMSNRRGLTSLRRRFQGEIGRLMQADEAMKERQKVMRTLSAQDPTMLYATENLNIDDYLDGKTGNEYGISGTSLDAAGAQMGAAISNRMYDTAEGEENILGGYYKDYIQTHGIQNAADFVTTDEFKTAMMQDLKSKGVIDNLTGANLQRAIDSYVTGAMKGIVYQESHNPQRDLGKIDAATAQQLALSKRGQDINLAMNGMTYDDRTGTITYNVDKDPAAQKAAEIAKIKAAAKGNGKTSSSKYSTQVSDRIRLKWNGNDPAESDEDLEDVTIEGVDKDDTTHSGDITPYDNLPARIKTKVKKIIGNGDPDEYDIYYKPFKGGTFNDDEAELEIVPRKIIKTNNDDDASVGINFGDI